MPEYPYTPISKILPIEEPKPPTIRKMLYRIIHLLVMRVEIRVEAKTKSVFREVNHVREAVRVEH